MMDKTVMALAAKLLEMASDEFSNHVCNDFELQDTPVNRELVLAAEKRNDGLDHDASELNIYNGNICTQDFFLMHYCADVLRGLSK